MPGRLLEKADFERLLGTRYRVRSAHFAVHHLPAMPSRRMWTASAGTAAELSTGPAPLVPRLVDDFPPDRPAAHWLGCVVPKRHARRAVTRNLLKRQVRAAFDRHTAALPAGLWLVRLKQGWPVTDFPSARSAVLAAAARAELDLLLVSAAG